MYIIMRKAEISFGTAMSIHSAQIDLLVDYITNVILGRIYNDCIAEPHSSVGCEIASSIPGSDFFSEIDDCHCDRIHSDLTAAHCVDVGHVGK